MLSIRHHYCISHFAHQGAVTTQNDSLINISLPCGFNVVADECLLVTLLY